MSFDTKTLIELRKITGAGVVDCQEALTQSGGNIEKAIEILRKKGTLKAAKKAEREAREGVIDATVAPDQKKAIILQVHCETDFVAKNDSFIQFVHDIGLQSLNSGNDPRSFFDSRKESIVLKTGENIVFGRFDQLEGGYIQSYIHPNRKVGVLVQFSSTVSPEFGRDIAMHVAASNPQYLSSQDVPAEILQKEKDIYREQMRGEKKPDAIVEKIIMGKLQKFIEENCLLLQSFIKSEDVTIEKLLAKENNVKILKFIRYQLG